MRIYGEMTLLYQRIANQELAKSCTLRYHNYLESMQLYCGLCETPVGEKHEQLEALPCSHLFHLRYAMIQYQKLWKWISTVFAFGPFLSVFYVLASPRKSMRFFVRIFISPYLHWLGCFILINIFFENFVYERWERYQNRAVPLNKKFFWGENFCPVCDCLCGYGQCGRKRTKF